MWLIVVVCGLVGLSVEFVCVWYGVILCGLGFLCVVVCGYVLLNVVLYRWV